MNKANLYKKLYWTFLVLFIIIVVSYLSFAYYFSVLEVSFIQGDYSMVDVMVDGFSNFGAPASSGSASAGLLPVVIPPTYTFESNLIRIVMPISALVSILSLGLFVYFHRKYRRTEDE